MSLFYCEAAPLVGEHPIWSHLEILINKRNLIPRDKMNPDGPEQRSDRSNVKPPETKRLYLESEPLGVVRLRSDLRYPLRSGHNINYSRKH